MRNLLIVSPYFPPLNTADMHRVRISLPFFEDNGWKPYVLTVDPAYARGVWEPTLVQTIPGDIPIVRTRAVPLAWSRWLAVGSLGLRALPFLYRRGLELLSDRRFDLVYFSTTEFPVLVLGRLWRARTGTPFVFDMQDPWISEYYEQNPDVKPPSKYNLAKRLHARLEPWAMRDVAGLIAVSDAYITTLHARYPHLKDRPAVTLPFGAAQSDIDVAVRQMKVVTVPQDTVRGIYVGRGGPDMRVALDVIFSALRLGLERNPEQFRRVRLEFTGTDYAPRERAQKTVAPVAEIWGVGDQVSESPGRIRYFEALANLLSADFLLVPGSDDPQYTASKIYPYILAKRPLLAVFHSASSVVNLLRKTGAGTVVTFSGSTDAPAAAEALYTAWKLLLEQLPYTPNTDWSAFAPYTAQETSRKQCELFAEAVRS